ncbi:hypothetical protein FRC00_010692, partial [Tulasnella sp. 408]
MKNLGRSSPAIANQNYTSDLIPDYPGRSSDQLTIETAERPPKMPGLRRFLLPSGRSKPENAAQHPPSGKEKQLQTAASRHARAPVQAPVLVEQLHPPSQLGNESSANLAEYVKNTFNPLKLLTRKERDGARWTAGKAGSIKSPQTPTLSDRNGTTETSFSGQMGSSQPQDLTLHQPLPTSTPVSPVPSSPPTAQAAKPPIPQNSPPLPFSHPPPSRSYRKSMKQTLNSLKLNAMKLTDGTRSTAGKTGSTESRPQTPALSDPNGTPKTLVDGQLALPRPETLLSHPPVPVSTSMSPVSSSSLTAQVSSPPPPPAVVQVAPVQRARPLRSPNSTVSPFSGFDPRSSTYQFIHSAIDFSDPNMPDLNFLDGLNINVISAAPEEEVLDHEGGPGDSHDREHEENKEEIVGAQTEPSHERLRSLSVLTRTLSEASRGALSMLGTGGIGDAHRWSLRKHHQRTRSTTFEMVGQQQKIGDAVTELLAGLREEDMTDNGLGDDEDQVGTDEGKATLTVRPTEANSPPSPTSTSPGLLAAHKDQPSFCLNSPPLSPAPSDRRAASPPLIFPMLPQAPATGRSSPEVTRSIAFPVPPPTPSPVQTITSILLPKRKSLTTRRVSHPNGSTADVAVGMAPDTDRDGVSCSTSPPPPQSSHALTSPLPSLQVQPQVQSPSTPPIPKLRLPSLSVGRGKRHGERDVKNGQDLPGLRPKPKRFRKKNPGDVGDDESVVKSSRQALPVVEVTSTSTTSSTFEVASPDRFQAIRGTDLAMHPPAPPNPVIKEIPDRSIHMPSQMMVPPSPRAVAQPSFGWDDRMSDLADQRLGLPAQNLHSDTLHRSSVASGRPNSKHTFLQRSSLHTTRASLASSNGSNPTTSVDEDTSQWATTSRTSYASQPPSPLPSVFPPATPPQRSQTKRLKQLRAEMPGKDKSYGGSKNNPGLSPVASRSVQTRTETVSSTAWSDREDSPVATTRAPSMFDSSGPLEREEGAANEYQRVQGYQGYPQPPIQRSRTSDRSYSPTSAEMDDTETILRTTLDELVHLYVPPERLNMLPSTEIGLGKYGEVVMAELDNGSQMPVLVAVKELRPVETRARLARELKIWATVKHPNILPLIGYYLSKNYEIARFISPFMPNGNVSQYLERGEVGLLKRLDI